MRELHWIPFRKTVLEKSPMPLTGVSQGIVVRGPLVTRPLVADPNDPIGWVPVQLDPTSAPAVVNRRLAWKVVGKLPSTLVEMLDGRFVFRKLIKLADGIWAGKATPTPDRRISTEPNTKSFSLRIGPPALPANSFRRKTGRSGW